MIIAWRKNLPEGYIFLLTAPEADKHPSQEIYMLHPVDYAYTQRTI